MKLAENPGDEWKKSPSSMGKSTPDSEKSPSSAGKVLRSGRIIYGTEKKKSSSPAIEKKNKKKKQSCSPPPLEMEEKSSSSSVLLSSEGGGSGKGKVSEEEEEVLNWDDDDDDDDTNSPPRKPKSKSSKLLSAIDENYDLDWEYDSEENHEFEPWCTGAVKRKDCPAWVDYKKQIHYSRGYEVSIYPGLCAGAKFMPWNFKEDNGETVYEEFLEMCDECIQSYNAKHHFKEGEGYLFTMENDDVIEHVTRKFEIDYNLYYITFKARLVQNPNVIHTFRAKYFVDRGMREGLLRFVKFCERKDVLDAQWAKEEEEKDVYRCSDLPCCPSPYIRMKKRGLL
ncbi:OLC1v1038452C1 [Oldenlandia corymbosa var. corymbosa]|uniref:OLC1v1038452C1 n=1 Tax=Oldenlandia corymbosa var. corymbosa TaxID=529605 RepID=A0AAV1D263_OLDCO|nr:OLC1v1038452C1 [Oldenlandia corymbosa var. corymbosa]